MNELHFPLSANPVEKYGGNDPSHAASAQSAGDISCSNATTWDYLFAAVTARLRRTVGSGLLNGTATPATQPASVRDSVLECVDALEQLRLTASETHFEPSAPVIVNSRGRTRLLQDYPTALPNRAFFRARLDHALAQANADSSAVAVLYLDLDGFKSFDVANGYGYDVDTNLLNTIAARVTASVRDDDMVSHMGGDEFACLMTALTTREQLSDLACKLLVATSAPLTVGRLKLKVEPSIGIAVCPREGATADVLLTCANAAMYRAKREKSGYAFFRSHDERVTIETTPFSHASVVDSRPVEQFQHTFAGGE